MALDDFTHESLQDAGSIADYLLALNDGFKKGQLTLEEGEEALILEPRGPLDMTIRATREHGKCNLVLSVSWNEQAAEVAASSPLTIHTGD